MTAPPPGTNGTLAELRAHGKSLRAGVPRSAHGEWTPPRHRPDPVQALRQASTTWIPELVPVRFARMAASPLAFLRGAAAQMAADVGGMPRTGLAVQAIGDAHLLNFGSYGTPEERLVFDVDDFDETLPGPWEVDLQRLAASITLAARELGLGRPSTAATAAAAGYRLAMQRFAGLDALELFRFEQTVHGAQRLVAGLTADVVAWSKHTSRWQLPKLAAVDGDRWSIVARPPITVPVDGAVDRDLRALPGRYGATLLPERRELLARYEVVDVARHTVGVGSCGTHCHIVLLRGRAAGDPLFLQVKEARASVLADAWLGSRVDAHTPTPGERVVLGQRRAQPGPDPLLGWCEVGGRPVYVRQLRDRRGSVDLSRFQATDLRQYASLCGATLARAHARTGEPAVIAGYLGSSDIFDRSIARFAAAYADQTERDHAAFVAALGPFDGAAGG
ncbi:MAG: DUF2252 domain-containing protein [Solirubrobacteraceae bacterium]|nr:DUF2252 domain-containing protein [Patulibacter sp.]